jgi:eukaryotic-like serine/threonine-protein kinase
MGRELREGSLIASRYRLDRLLGEGGFAVVWAATHIVTRKRVALKFLKDVYAADTRFCQRFLREARAACAVNHPNIIAIHDVFADESGPLMVMDLLEGESLGDRLKRDGKLSLQQVGAIMLPVISAVETAHSAGILHRDLKPDNIFVLKKSGPASDDAVEVKVLDFGIAKITALEGDSAQSASLTNSGGLVGTPLYMSPEQALGDRALDRRSDVWAIGVILYECLAGVRPIEAETFGLVIKKLVAAESIPPLSKHRPELPAELTGIVDRTLTIDRSKRPALAELCEVVGRHTGVRIPPLAARPAEPVPSGLDEKASPAGPRDGRPSTQAALTLSGSRGVRRIGPTMAIAVGAIAAFGGGFAVWRGATHAPASSPGITGSVAGPVGPTPESVPAIAIASATVTITPLLPPTTVEAGAPDAAASVPTERASARAAATKPGPPTVKANTVPNATATSSDPGGYR